MAEVRRLYPILIDCQNYFPDSCVSVQEEKCIRWVTVAVAHVFALLGPNPGNLT